MESPRDGARSRELSKEVSFKDMETGEISRPGTGSDVRYRPGSRPVPGVSAQIMEPETRRASSDLPSDMRSSSSDEESGAGPSERPVPHDTDLAAAQEIQTGRPSRSGEVLVVDEDSFDGIAREFDSSAVAGSGMPSSAVAETHPTRSEQTASITQAQSDGSSQYDETGFGRVTSAPGPRTVGTPAVVADMAMVRVLRFVHTFSQLDVSELRELARHGLTIKFKPGDTIVEQGEAGDSMFVVFSGTVRLHTDLGELATVRSQANQTLVLTRGHSFGESALVWQEEGKALRGNDGREWRVKALTHSVVLELTKDVVLDMLLQHCPDTVEELEEEHKDSRAALRLQRWYRKIKLNMTQKQRLIDMLAKAARDMVAELKNLTPHARAYMAIRSSLSHEMQEANKPLPPSQTASAETDEAGGVAGTWAAEDEQAVDEDEEEEEEGKVGPSVLRLMVVSVVQSMGLPERAGVGGKAGRAVDARCACSLGDKTYVSDPVLASCDPYWNAAFAFPLPTDAEKAQVQAEVAERYAGKSKVDERKRQIELGELIGIEVYDERLQGRWLGPKRRVLLGRGQIPAKIGHSWLTLTPAEVGEEEVRVEVIVRKFELAEKILKGSRRQPSHRAHAAGATSPSRFEVRGEIQSEKAKLRRREVAQKVVDWIATEAARPPPPPPTTLAHPSGTLRRRLDAAALVAALASLFLAPLSACFGIGRTEGEWLLLLSTLCDLIGMVDVHYKLRSSFLFLEEGSPHWQPELRWWRCVDHYLDTPALHAVALRLEHLLVAVGILSPRRRSYRQSAWLSWWGGGDALPAVTAPAKGMFWLDAVSAVPAELLLLSARSGVGGWHGFLRVVQTAKALKVLRIRRDLDAWHQARPQRFKALTTLRLAFYLFLSLHWVACLWFLALRSSHDLEAWMRPDATCDDREYLLSPSTHSAWRYVCAWYWTVQTATGVGYGDIPLLTSGERVLAVAVMVGGLFVTVYSVSSLVGWIQDAPNKQALFSKRVARLRSFLRMRKLPRKLQGRVEAFYEEDWEWRRGEADLEVLAPLPLSLRVRALMGMYGRQFRNVAFFSDHLTDLRFWRMLLEGMTEVCYMEGEYVMREGERGDAMFIIKTGSCEVLSEKREQPRPTTGEDARRLSVVDMERVESDDGPGEGGAGLAEWVFQDIGNDEMEGGLPAELQAGAMSEEEEAEEEGTEIKMFNSGQQQQQHGAPPPAASVASPRGGSVTSPRGGSVTSPREMRAWGEGEWEDVAEWEREEDMDLVGGRADGWYSFGLYGAGDHFGESGVVGGEERLRGASVRTRSYCNMFVVSAECLLKVRSCFPDVALKMDAFIEECRRGAARQRWRMVWVKHKARILRAAQIIPYPPRPWPYMVLPEEGLSRVFSGPAGGEAPEDIAHQDDHRMLRMSL